MLRLRLARSAIGLTAVVLGALAAQLAACSPSAEDNDIEGSGGGSSTGDTSGTGLGGDDTIDPTTTSSGGDGGLDPDSACATSSEEAVLVPVNMFIAVDKSGSMSDSSKWTNAEAAFSAFFQDPAAASLRVALRFWPDDGCDGGACNIDVCAQPQVGVGPLSDPAQVSALVSLFASKDPGGGTPTWAALGGATKWAKDYAAQTGGSEKVVVVLVTDGEPTECDTNISSIASFADDAWQNAQIPTFAVGMVGSNETDMNTIAAAGGTTTGIFIGNGNAQQELLDALLAIQKSTVACEFAMPQGDPGTTVDPTKVNVNYTPGGSDMAQTIGQVNDAAACGSGAGWFYDDNNAPTKIILCPGTCTAVQADDGAKIEILLGCDTKPA
jgi:hypothetical protein